MDRDQVKRQLLEKLGLRVGDHMADYIGKRIATDRQAPFSIIAANARTGVPVQTTLSPADLHPPAASE